MSPELHILRDLLAGQSTADSLAARVGLRPPAAEVILRRLQAEGKVHCHPLGGVLSNTHVYRLNPEHPTNP